MRSQDARQFSRRRFLGGLTLAGTAGLLGLRPAPVAAEPPPETRRIRLIKITGICVAPQYVADDLLRAEGFTDVEYVPATAGIEAAKAVGSGAAGAGGPRQRGPQYDGARRRRSGQAIKSSFFCNISQRTRHSAGGAGPW